MNPCTISKPIDGIFPQKIELHALYVEAAKCKSPDVVLIGDSIIQYLTYTPLWDQKFSTLNCLNFGIGGDRVEHVLWRIQNGELDFKDKVKIVVLLVGTNNVNDTPEDIFEGICNIVKHIQNKLKDVTIVLPTLLPKGQTPNPFREKNTKVNKLLIEEFEDKEKVHVVQINKNIVQKDGTISKHIMYDYLKIISPPCSIKFKSY